LNQASLSALGQAGLGELAARLGARPLSAVELFAGRSRARLALPVGMALSREALDTALVQEAVNAGATFLPYAEAALQPEIGVERKVLLRGRNTTGTAVARVVVAADGLAGRFLQKLPEFDPVVALRAAVGAGTIVEAAPNGFCEGTIYMACGPGGYVGVVRLEDGRLDVAAALEIGQVRRCGSPATLARKILTGAGLLALGDLPPSAWQGTAPLTRHRRYVAGERLFVVGDAAGYVEPFTGEGIGWAMQGALLMAPLVLEAIDAWDRRLADRWQMHYNRLIVRRQMVCRIVRTLLWRPRLAIAAARVLNRAPWLASPALRRINAPIPTPQTD
jgi:flavin-dependent dehydrogenase